MAGGRTETSDSAQFEWVRHALGLAGKPTSDVHISSGKLRTTVLYLELDAEDGGADFSVSRADLPIPLPVKVHGVNPNWSTGIWDQDRQAFLPCGTLDGATVAALDTKERGRHVFVGNVVACNQPDAVVALVPEDNGRWKVQVNNPSDQPRKLTIRTPQAIKAFHIYKTVEVPAGGQVEFSP